MFKRGGLASYTKTGRRMQYGAAVGAAMARGGSKSSSEKSEEPSCFITFMFMLMVALLLDAITTALKQKQLQPQ